MRIGRVSPSPGISYLQCLRREEEKKNDGPRLMIELDSAAESRERDKEIAQLIQDNDLDDDMDEL